MPIQYFYNETLVSGISTSDKFLYDDLDAPFVWNALESFMEDPSHPNDPLRPKAYLNWVLLDDQGLQPVAGAFGKVQVPEITGVVEKKLLQLAWGDYIDIPVNGFLYVFLSNESKGNVYFDDIRIEHIRGPLLEETHYYPFGLKMAGISSKAFGGVENRFKYNGKELQANEFSDGSGLEWTDYGARMYDAQLGRFFNIDRYTENYFSLNPYHYAANDPNNLIDINGDSIWFSFQYNKAGKLSGVTMNVTGKIINLSDRKVDMEEAISDISSGISNTFRGAIRVNGKEVSFQTNVQLSEAMSMDQVEDSDHLIVLANASGKEGNARGAANMIGGKTMFVDANDFPTKGGISGLLGISNTRTTQHELGHLAGLEHNNSFFNLMKQRKSGTLLMNSQLLYIFNNRNALNKGVNSIKSTITGQKTPNTTLIYKSQVLNINDVGLRLKLNKLK